MEISDEDIILWKVWGKYLEYPECCVEAFCYDRENLDFDTLFEGSGYVPCKSCAEKVCGMSEDEAYNWLGRDPFHTYKSYEDKIKTTIDKIKSETFILISKELNFDYVGYKKYWEDHKL